MGFTPWRQETIDRQDSGSRVRVTRRGVVEYAEVGPSGGPPVLVLHGRPGGYDQGLLLARGIGEERARWLAVSRPGYLRTPLESGHTPVEQADLYAALLDALHVQKAAVLALSGGGPSAWQFAIRHPNRCAGLVMISTVTRRRPASQRPVVQKVFDSWVLGSDRLARVFYGLLGGDKARRAGCPPKDAGLACLLQLLELPATRRRAGLLNDLAQFSDLPDDPPPGVSCPVLFLHGTADGIVTPAHAERAAAAAPGASLVTVEGGGHGMVWSDAPRVAPAVQEFLARLDPRG